MLLLKTHYNIRFGRTIFQIVQQKNFKNLLTRRKTYAIIYLVQNITKLTFIVAVNYDKQNKLCNGYRRVLEKQYQ